ncbi:peroxiredoxin [Stenotrophomonas panacihumi]|uniref:Peroxiredoxin n=1 Tax=Stenotrophomonas panacihumi TaxID=676599 RepID=A0A0R0AQ14_9GAMM|nr:organic hydroperoxide resistance protein [Stenotrophomonas panacihumi]KRG43159.1 peroxiredoxin [Stenotrophomonas panacihumi]PTN53913.1 organic hydroperoxide resistance protein [Stenotrophomonas panacihumi]
MQSVDKVLYTGKTHVVGGREGHARSDDGQLDVTLSPPGSGRPGTNPEQLFAAGWSACFEGAMKKAARGLQIALPAGTAIDAEIDLGLAGEDFQLQARLTVSLPGLPREQAQALVEQAHRTCPYSRATRGNIGVRIDVV